MQTQDWTQEDLKAWRSAQGWTQAKAAEELGISRESLINLEKGKYPIDRRTMLACLALTGHLPGLPNGWAPSTDQQRELAAGAAVQLLTGAHNVMLLHGHAPWLIAEALEEAAGRLRAESAIRPAATRAPRSGN